MRGVLSCLDLQFTLFNKQPRRSQLGKRRVQQARVKQAEREVLLRCMQGRWMTGNHGCPWRVHREDSKQTKPLPSQHLCCRLHSVPSAAPAAPHRESTWLHRPRPLHSL